MEATDVTPASYVYVGDDGGLLALGLGFRARWLTLAEPEGHARRVRDGDGLLALATGGNGRRARQQAHDAADDGRGRRTCRGRRRARYAWRCTANDGAIKASRGAGTCWSGLVARCLRIRLSQVDDVDAFLGTVVSRLLSVPGIAIADDARTALQRSASRQ